MDYPHSGTNDAFNLSLHGTAIQPGTISSRPSSARSNSQSKRPLTPSRGGSTKDNKTSLTTSMNLSSARQRRYSNSSQRSVQLTTPPPDIKQSTSSSVFRGLSPRHDDAEAFFTDHEQEKSFSQKGDDDEWDETRHWIDELHQLNSSFIPQQQSRGVGTLGMSRDSLNGTMAGTNVIHSNDNRYEQHKPSSHIVGNGQTSSGEPDLNAENASINIQRWYRENDPKRKSTEAELKEKVDQAKFEDRASLERTHELEILISLEQKQTLPKETHQQENNNRLNNHRPSTPTHRPSSANSTSRHRTTPVPSTLPPSVHINDKMTPASSIASSSVASKVTLNDVYETLRKLEEVEQFPTQPPLKDDSVYLLNPTAATIPPPPVIYKPFSQTANRTDSTLSHLNETNQNDLTIESARSQKSTTRETSSPIITRFNTPPPSARRQLSTKVSQSVSALRSRMPPSFDEQTRHRTKVTTPSKSLMVAVHPPSPRQGKVGNGSTTFRTSEDVTEKGIQSRMDNEEKLRQSIILQQRLNQQRELNIHRSKESEHGLEHDLQSEKNEYEIIIQRHLLFIDQLIDDKKKLSERCERLVFELKTIDQNSNDRIKSLEESHRLELQKIKDVNEAAEKIRRERWIEEKTKKIKELTVRGLEPEIQNLISKHKNELSKMKSIHQAELLTADERASQRYIRMTEELRDQLEREKEVAIAHERELARDKYEKALRDEEKSFTEQRRRLFTEIDEEKNRQAEVATKQRAELDKLRRDIEQNHQTVSDTTKRDYEAARLEQERRHNSEIHELKEKLTLEKQNWEENYMKNQETVLANKERQLREQMKHERDKEIEKIISQFESDTTMTKEEAERTAESRVKRIRDKYETEFRELENSEKQTKERFNQIKAQITEVQGENERLQAALKHKETEINDIKKITDALQQERERLSDIIRQEFADRLVRTDEENRRVKGEIAELRARQQLELDKKKEEVEALQRQQEKELETIQEKIKQAITKKDEQVQALRVQYETAMKRAQHLEGLLSQQRKLISTTPSSSSSASKKAQPS